MNTLTGYLRGMLCLTGLMLIMGILPDTAVADTIYKTVDAQGNITFSNTPPPAGANAQQVDLPPGPTPAEEQQDQQQEQELENSANEMDNGNNPGAQQPPTEQPTSEYQQGAGDDQGTAVVDEGYVGNRTRDERARDRVDDMREVVPGSAAVRHPAGRVR